MLGAGAIDFTAANYERSASVALGSSAGCLTRRRAIILFSGRKSEIPDSPSDQKGQEHGPEYDDVLGERSCEQSLAKFDDHQ